jgi:hypothetical protein
MPVFTRCISSAEGVQRMTRQEDEGQSMMQGRIGQDTIDGETPAHATLTTSQQ